MLKALLHYMLISTAVFAADHSDPFSSPTASSAKNERVILSEESGEPSAKKQRLDTTYETMYMFLPDELITHIATFTRIKDGIQMGSTCKNWKQALDQSDIWEKYYAPRLPGYEFFKDAPCFKQEDGSIDYKRIIKAATYPFIFIFKEEFTITSLQRDGSSLLGNISPEDINIIFNPVLNEKEGIRSAVPYTFHSASPYYSPSSTQTVIKNYQKEFGNNQRICFHYDIHQGTLEFIEAPDDEQGTTKLIFISKNRETIIGKDIENDNPIHIWRGKEGARTYHSLKGYPNKVLKDGKLILGRHKKQAHVWSQEPYYTLKSLNGGLKSKAHDISKDGTIIVGKAEDGAANNEWRAVKWTNGIIQSLGTLNGGTYSQAIAISSNGNIIIGNAEDGSADNELRAVKWTNEIIQPLDVLRDGYGSKAHGMSADGQVIVGQSWQDKMPQLPEHTIGQRTDCTAVRWTSKGIEGLTRLLKNILPPVTELINAIDVDVSGNFIMVATRSKKEFLKVVPHEIPSLAFTPEFIKSNDTHQRNADGSFMLGLPYSWEAYLAEKFRLQGKEEETDKYFITAKGNSVWGNPTSRIIVLKEITIERKIHEEYLAFVPREDILEKEGLRAHF